QSKNYSIIQKPDWRITRVCGSLNTHLLQY
ncbi:MAG: hypothetical protein ACI81F_002727, partial [Thalassolituus oleivorans]